MKTYLPFILSLCLTVPLSAQSLQPEWAKSINANNDQYVLDAVSDGGGNIIITGCFRGTADFDPGPGVVNFTSLSSEPDIFVEKLSASGNLIWVKTFGSKGNEAVNDLAIDALGQIYLGGYFTDTIRIPVGPHLLFPVVLPNTAMGVDGFALKLDSAGEVYWIRKFAGVNTDVVSGIDVDAAGNVYLAGSFQINMDADPLSAVYSLNSDAGSTDMFLEKLTPTGGMTWAYRIGGPGHEEPGDLSLDAQENILITGTYQGTVNFSPNGPSATLTSVSSTNDAFILKLSPALNTYWVRGIGGRNDQLGMHITSDQNGNVLATGTMDDSTDIDPGPGIQWLPPLYTYLEDIYTIKLSPTGTMIWGHSIGSTGNDQPGKIITTPQGYSILTGYYRGIMDADPGTGTFFMDCFGSLEMFIQVLDDNGQFITASYSQTTPGPLNSTLGQGVAWGTGNQLYAAGYYSCNTDLQPGSGSLPLTNNQCSTLDAFVVKYDLCLPNASISQNGFQLSRTNAQPGETYQWINCNGNTAIAGATAETFTPAADGDYALIVQQGLCTDTSACITVSGMNVPENAFADLRIYPNPASNYVTIDLGKKMEHIAGTIEDLSGRQLQEFNFTSASVLPLALHLPAGIYILRVLANDRCAAVRLVIQ